MIELTPELIRKYSQRLVEAKVRVKGHTRHSKTGKAFNVQTYDRELTPRQREQIKFASIKQLRGYQKHDNPTFAAEASAELKRRAAGIGGFASTQAKHKAKFGDNLKSTGKYDSIYGSAVPKSERKFTGDPKKDWAIFVKGAALYPDRDREINVRPGGMKRSKFGKKKK